VPRRLWNALKDGWKTSHKRSGEECSPGSLRPSKKKYFFLFFHIYEKCGLERNNLEMVTQDEASIEPSASSYEGHEERGAV